MRIVFVWLAVLAFPALGFARTWVVDGGGSGDFTRIQQAIDAAADGDVVVVRPGSYSPFNLNKGVIITAASSFSVNHSSPERVVIGPTNATQKAGISGMVVEDDWEITPVRIVSCQGEVILEDIRIGSPRDPRAFTLPPWPTSTHILFSASNNVSVTTLEIGPFLYVADPRGTVSVVSSSVRFSDCSINGGDGVIWDNGWFLGPGISGSHAVEALNSTLVFARSRAIGGNGTDGLGLGDYLPQPDGGDGGDGIRATNSEVVLLGNESDAVIGGQGGDGVFVVFLGWVSDGGDGGDGFLSNGQGGGLVSRVTGTGGQKGLGRQDGNDGVPYDGAISFDHRLPYTEMNGDLRPGGFLQLEMNGQEPGAAVLLLSGRGGFLDIASSIGPPLSAIPGQWFFFFNLGRLDGQSPQSFTFPLVDNPIIQGLNFNAQSIVLSDQGQFLFGNSVTRIARE